MLIVSVLAEIFLPVCCTAELAAQLPVESQVVAPTFLQPSITAALHPLPSTPTSTPTKKDKSSNL